MSQQVTPSLDIEAVKQTEIACRRLLLQQPEDLETRINVAWCLLLRALFRAGMEARSGPRANLQSTSRIASITMDGLGGDSRSSRSLLNECLRHTSIVKQLGIDAEAGAAATEVQTQLSAMQSLIGILGCRDQVLMAEAQVSRILDRIAGDLSQ